MYNCYYYENFLNFTYSSCSIINISINFMKFINALVVKLVDTKDLKSLPLAECQLSPAEGTKQNK